MFSVLTMSPCYYTSCILNPSESVAAGTLASQNPSTLLLQPAQLNRGSEAPVNPFMSLQPHVFLTLCSRMFGVLAQSGPFRHRFRFVSTCDRSKRYSVLYSTLENRQNTVSACKIVNTPLKRDNTVTPSMLFGATDTCLTGYAEIVLVNEIVGGAETAGYLLKYDSIHGTW